VNDKDIQNIGKHKLSRRKDKCTVVLMPIPAWK